MSQFASSFPRTQVLRQQNSGDDNSQRSKEHINMSDKSARSEYIDDQCTLSKQYSKANTYVDTGYQASMQNRINICCRYLRSKYLGNLQYSGNLIRISLVLNQRFK